MHVNVTPPQFKLEPEKDSFLKRVLLCQGGIFRWPMLNFRGVSTIDNEGTIGCTPNSVPMVFSWCSLGILGD